MIWDESTIEKLSAAFQEKHKQMFDRTSIDRKNRSALWNKYIKNYECKIIRNDVPGKSQVLRNSDIVIKNMVNLVNFRNDWLANSLVIPNPDRYGQWIIVSRDMAERILAIGMI
jgi:hypothetical protein